MLPRLAPGIGLVLMMLGLFSRRAALAQTNFRRRMAAMTPNCVAALNQKMAELDAQEAKAAQQARIHVVPASTNSGPRFRVDRFVVEGNTLLTPGTIAGHFHKRPRRVRHERDH